MILEFILIAVGIVWLHRKIAQQDAKAKAEAAVAHAKALIR